MVEATAITVTEAVGATTTTIRTEEEEAEASATREMEEATTTTNILEVVAVEEITRNVNALRKSLAASKKRRPRATAKSKLLRCTNKDRCRWLGRRREFPK